MFTFELLARLFFNELRKSFWKKMKFEFLIFWFSSLLEENISSFSTNISSTYVLENNFGKGNGTKNPTNLTNRVYQGLWPS